jgi:ankyrin repeat protein
MKIKNPLLSAIYENEDGLFEKVETLLEAGANPNEKTEYFETPLRVASNIGRFDVVKLLFDQGGDPIHLNWTELFHAIAYGSIDDVKNHLLGSDLSARDTWDRTPFLLAIQSGDIEKAALVLNAGANLNEKGRCAKRSYEYVIKTDDDQMLKWLIQKGIDIEQYNDFGYTPLIQASESGATKCCTALVEAGADIFKRDRSQFSRKTAIAEAANVEIAKLLVAAGDDINNIDTIVREVLLGFGEQDLPDISKNDYLEQKYRVFGKSNPELCNRSFYYQMTKSQATAWQARNHFGDEKKFKDTPVWCNDRVGKSITDLGNGAYIEIGGEHEDHYDPEFCIYNEVFFHHGGGEFDIYMYPKEVLPPIDFHTATLVSDYIYVIGCLGYPEDRKYGETPVYRLNTKTFEIEIVVTSGDLPGWVYNHNAYFDGKSSITIKGGEILKLHEGEEIHSLNTYDYVLCLDNFTWSRHRHLPLTKEPEYFPEEYKQFSYSDGTLMAYENDGKWRLLKILKVHIVDISKRQTIIVAGKNVTCPVNDFLFAVFCSFGDEYGSFEALEEIVNEKTYTLQPQNMPYRTTQFSDRLRYISSEKVSQEELQSFERWKKDYETGSVSLL